VSQNIRIYFVHYNGEMKQECVKNLNIFTDCSFMNVSIRSIWNKQQRVFRDFYWLVNLTNKYCYRVCSSVVTYLYVKGDNWHFTCSAYWNWLQWKGSYFVCLLKLVTIF